MTIINHRARILILSLILISQLKIVIGQTLRNASYDRKLNTNSATIKVYLNRAYSGDTLYVDFSAGLIKGSGISDPINNVMPHQNFSKVIANDGSVTIKVRDFKGFGYFSIYKDYEKDQGLKIPLVDMFLLKSGDNIKIDIKSDSIYKAASTTKYLSKRKYHLFFSGKGSEKLKWYYSWRYPESSNIKTFSIDKVIQPFNSDGTFNKDNYFKKSYLFQLNELNKIISRIGKPAYFICKADLIGDYLYTLGNIGNANSSFGNIIKEESNGLPDSAKSFSKMYASGVYRVEKTKYRSKNISLNEGFYEVLKTDYSGDVKGKLITYFLIEDSSSIQNMDSLLRDCMLNVNNPLFRKKMSEAATRISGISVFNFKLLRISGDYISLGSLKNKIVVADLWFTGCSGCAIYYHETLKEVEKIFSDNSNIVFLSICLDAAKDSWTNSIKKEIYTSEERKNIMNLYTNGKGFNDPFIKYYNIQGCPVTFIIDEKGKLIMFNNSGIIKKDALIKRINQALEAKS